jgi:hypothetical protein
MSHKPALSCTAVGSTFALSSAASKSTRQLRQRGKTTDLLDTSERPSFSFDFSDKDRRGVVSEQKSPAHTAPVKASFVSSPAVKIGTCAVVVVSLLHQEVERANEAITFASPPAERRPRSPNTDSSSTLSNSSKVFLTLRFPPTTLHSVSIHCRCPRRPRTARCFSISRGCRC